jgi:glyoxalase family protein
MESVTGLHHVTAISGRAQENLDFYTGRLGMRLVKKSVNQDDPETYHLFYADAAGHPGTDLTFFPWERAAPARPGHGLASEVALAVPPGSLAWWRARLESGGVAVGALETRHGEPTLPFTDPHGQPVSLVETDAAPGREFAPWAASPVPAEHQVRGLHGARLVERDLAPTAAFLTGTLGFRAAGEERGWHRFVLGEGGSGRHLDVAVAPDAPRGFWGVGSIHHLAWRVADDARQAEVRAQVEAAGRQPTPVIDRFWFRSVYFREPGGVLFELATDGPGFAVDEAPGKLGERLVLPPWLEAQRAGIEAALPPLTASRPAGAVR